MIPFSPVRTEWGISVFIVCGLLTADGENWTIVDVRGLVFEFLRWFEYIGGSHHACRQRKTLL
jgi:hypothetical protein